jgi:hypothetical protein
MVFRRNPSRSQTAGRSPRADADDNDDDVVRNSHSPELPSHLSPANGHTRTPTGKAFTNAQMAALRKQAEAATLRNQIDQADHAHELRRLERAKAEAELAAINRGASGTSVSNAFPDALGNLEQGELYSPQVLSVTMLFPGVQTKEVNLVLHGKFDAYSLHKLRSAIGGNDDELLRHLMSIDGSSNRLVFAKARASTKDFGDDPTIWMQGFIVYIRIVAALFPDHPRAITAMLHFYSRVQQWTVTYSWPAVLKLALNWHSNVMSTSQLAVDSWRNVPLEWIDYYLSASTLASRLIKKTRSETNLNPDRLNKASPTNVPSQNCRNFNTEEGCRSDWCKRTHKCLSCNSKDHGQTKCRS